MIFPLAHWDLRDSIHIVEGKLFLNNEEFGKMISYFSLMSVGLADKTPLLGMLFDNSSFWLLEYERPSITRCVKGKWTTPGSVDAIRCHSGLV